MYILLKKLTSLLNIGAANVLVVDVVSVAFIFYTPKRTISP